MKIDGWFLLRRNGTLQFVSEKDNGIRGSLLSMLVNNDLVTFWPFQKLNRATVWRILVEGLAAGADKAQIQELAASARCDDHDALIYAARIGCAISKEGVYWKATEQQFIPGVSKAGYGGTVLDAMGDLCKALGYVPSRIAPMDFAKMLKPKTIENESLN